MKPHFHKVPFKIERSYNIRHDIHSNFGTFLHYHPELELHYILKGEGVQFIGDSITNFAAGELMLLGENLPHTWRCKEEYFQQNSSLTVEVFVLHFLPDCLGKDFLNLPDAHLLPKLFERAKQGLRILGAVKEKIVGLMHKAFHAEGLDRVAILIAILKELAESSDLEAICSSYAFYQTELGIARLDKIYSYVFENYKREISLDEVASIANMSKRSFCRHFKLMTKRTFYQFLTEVRISHVRRALVEDKLNTEMICFECGFNNVSNFYRHFKRSTNMTPYGYKKKYLNGARLNARGSA